MYVGFRILGLRIYNLGLLAETAEEAAWQHSASS